MVKFNFLILLAAAVIPLIIGFIWYHPKVFGTAWMKTTGVTPEDGKKMNMPLVFGLTFLFSFLIAFGMQFVVIHQMSVFSVLANEPGIMDPNSEMGSWLVNFMAKYGNNFRTFKHGMLHGTVFGIMFVTPLIAINAMFERKGFKYIAINAGYWIVSLMLMGGLISACPGS
ncbi:MAG: hypothetical protein K0S33_3122 [Bacteroidetes bacterium]|jgi:hypothetical protein|nr:hypothetical protein [Bacteroidota bacterium]